MRQPLLSIVVANYNYGRFLDDAIRSVINQDMGDRVELIICDAASVDNSVEIIQKYACGLPAKTQRSESTVRNANSQSVDSLISWWCSEKDGGQSAAFNKGFSHANGKFLTWLNADDILLPGSLAKFQKAVEDNPECEWFVGGGMWLNSDMRILQMRRGCSFSVIRANRASLSAWGPSSFFTRRLFKSVGGVDERFHYMMDTDLWLRFYHNEHAKYKPFGDYAWGFRFHEDAKTSGHNFATSATNDEKHPMWEQVKQERKLLRENSRISGKLTILSRVFSVDYFHLARSMFDTIIYKGKKYEEYFAK